MLFGYFRDSYDYGVPLVFLLIFVITFILSIAAICAIRSGRRTKQRRWYARHCNIIIAVCMVSFVLVAIIWNGNRLYYKGLEYEASSEYYKAYDAYVESSRFCGLVYKDVKQHIDQMYLVTQYDRGLELMGSGKWEEAVPYFKNARDYADAIEMREYCKLMDLKTNHPEWFE